MLMERNGSAGVKSAASAVGSDVVEEESTAETFVPATTVKEIPVKVTSRIVAV